MHSLFIAGGIHAQELELQEGGEFSAPQLEQLCSSFAATPTHVLPWFRL